MFKLTLQIGLYNKNIVRKKEDFDIKSDLIYSNPFFNYRNPQKFQYKEGLYVLETMFCFLGSVQGVQCVLYYKPIWKIKRKKEDFYIKSGLI